MSTPDEFSEDEEPTRPQGIEHRATRLLSDWRSCTEANRARVERLAALLAQRRSVVAVIETRAPLRPTDKR